MKKRSTYIGIIVLSVLILGGIALLIGTQHEKKHFDKTITLSYKDKRPYGAYVAYQSLGRMFPGAEVTVGQRGQGFYRDLSDTDRHQVMIVVSPQFYVTREEWQTLAKWVRQGNYLVIAAYYFTPDAKDEFHIGLSSFGQLQETEQLMAVDDDSLSIGLSSPPFADTSTYFYPGRRLDRGVVSLDSDFTDVLGTNDMGYANLIRIPAARGAVILQFAPLAFSNYFLLYAHNIHYYESVLSVIPPGTTKVTWNEYYLYHTAVERKGSFFYELSKLFQVPAFAAAFFILLLLLALFVLLEAKRRQRAIPLVEPKTNESLDFVKTIGRLYYGEGDHKNLAIKMSQHFIEHIRTRYQLQLDLGDAYSMKRLAARSGVSEDITANLATSIRYIQDAPQLTREQLEEFYQLLESFYKTAQ